jgi:hypothetical protein
MRPEKLRPLRWEAALTLMFFASAALTLTLIGRSAFSTEFGEASNADKVRESAINSDAAGSPAASATRALISVPAHSFPSAASSMAPGAQQPSPGTSEVLQVEVHERQQLM